MITRLTILRKGLILIAVPLFFQLVFIALVAKMRTDGAAAEALKIHTMDVIAQAQKGRVRLLSAHGAIQGFILTRDPRFEGALGLAASKAPRDVAELEALVRDNPDQTAAAATIREEADAFLAYMVEGRAMVKDGRMDAPTASTRRLHSQDLLQSLEERFDRFLAVEQGLDALRHERLKRSWATFDGLLWGAVATSIFFTVALAIAFSRNISGRIASLTENTRRLAEGMPLTPPIAGGDEIARLDHVFHEMAGTLAESARREQLHAGVLERRAEELDSVNVQLREKARENEMFVYSVSHDLRSPLVNLQGFGKELEFIGKDLARLVDRDEVPPEVRRQARAMIATEMGESIGFIQTAVTRLSGIIDALLRLSRAGQVEYRRQQVDVTPIVGRVVVALRGTIEERGATVNVAELPTAWGDPTAIEQVFANLIGNALNYLDRARPGLIEVFAVEPDESGGPAEGVAPGSVAYAVRDNGLGISPSYKAKVFTAFQRLHGDVAKGEGVGLALVRRIVERLGGRVWFESEPGQGTTFYVSFPAAEPEADDVSGQVETVRDDVPSLLTTIENGRNAGWQPSR